MLVRVLALGAAGAAVAASCSITVSSGTGGAGGSTASTAESGGGVDGGGSGAGCAPVGTAGAPPSCESLPYFPGVESDCAPEGQLCSLEHACCGALAECKGGFWTALPESCDGPSVACDGELRCPVGSVCVQYTLGACDGPWFKCQPDPCAPDPLHCSCARGICKHSMTPECSVPSDSMIDCDSNCGG
jgi:hypothetical protein